MNAGTANPLRQLRDLGQSVWIDDIRRAWLADGTLARLIGDDGVAGVTSNPAILEKAMFGKTGPEGNDYDAALRHADPFLPAERLYERLVLEDLRAAADLLRPLYDGSGGRDGFVSLEVSPHLADDTEGTIHEAERLWRAFDRPNAMIKVPATLAGLPAIRALLAEGININITLLFGVARYRKVVEAFLAAMEERAAARRPLRTPASVASFFVSRIDTLVDAELDTRDTPQARALRGQAAIATARLAHEEYLHWRTDPRWRRLAALGAHAQRLLWASTSTKDPAYPDVKYVEALVAPDTVNTMPRATLEAYRDHGAPAVRIHDGLDQARATWRRLEALGVAAERVSRQLEREGIGKFVEPYDRLLAGIGKVLVGQARGAAPRPVPPSARP